MVKIAAKQTKALDRRIVGRDDRLDGVLADAAQVEDRFDEHRAAEQEHHHRADDDDRRSGGERAARRKTVRGVSPSASA